MLLRQCVDVPKVVLVKATHNERAPGSHVFNILRKVCQQNIFVDVGQNEVELSFLLQEGGITQFQLHLTYCIEFTIFGTVGDTPGIDIDSCNFGSTQFRRQDTQNAGAAAHIQHGFSFHFHLQQKGHDHRGGFVVSCSERHFGGDDDFHRDFWLGRMEGTAHHPFVFYYNGLKVVLFPSFIPVLVGDEFVRKGKARVVPGQFQTRQFLSSKGCFGNVGQQAINRVFETLETDLPHQCHQHVGPVFRIGGNYCFNLYVVHVQ